MKTSHRHPSFYTIAIASILYGSGIVGPAIADPAVTTVATPKSTVESNEGAYMNLEALASRYGCLSGFPDAQRSPLTRSEFAAHLNTCVYKVDELIAQGLRDKIRSEDLQTLQILQEEFAGELSITRRSQLQPFKPITTFSGNAVFSIETR